MSATIANILSNIQTKFLVLKEYVNLIETSCGKNCSEPKQDINDLFTQYHEQTSLILCDYFCSSDEVLTRKFYYKFLNAIHAINLNGKFKKIYSWCKLNSPDDWQNCSDENTDDSIEGQSSPTSNENVTSNCNYNHKNKQINHQVSVICNKFEISIIDDVYEETNSNECNNCHVTYEVEDKDSQFVCKKCGKLEKIYGAVFEDEQFFYQEGQRTKHGKYDPAKHAKAWLDRIQARENTEIPNEIITALKQCIRRDNVYLDILTCETIRSYLKELRCTNYNNHASLIKKIITGKEPAQLTDYETQLVFKYFVIVIQIFCKFKPDDKANCPYIPFFLYKIIEQILSSPKNRLRRIEILSCIHLQSRETLIENDRIWFSICVCIKDFRYVPTVM